MGTPPTWLNMMSELTLPHRGQHLQTVVRVQSLQQVHQTLRSWVVQLEKDHIKSCPVHFHSTEDAAGSLDHQPNQKEQNGLVSITVKHSGTDRGDEAVVPLQNYVHMLHHAQKGEEPTTEEQTSSSSSCRHHLHVETSDLSSDASSY